MTTQDETSTTWQTFGGQLQLLLNDSPVAMAMRVDGSSKWVVKWYNAWESPNDTPAETKSHAVAAIVTRGALEGVEVPWPEGVERIDEASAFGGRSSGDRCGCGGTLLADGDDLDCDGCPAAYRKDGRHWCPSCETWPERWTGGTDGDPRPDCLNCGAPQPGWPTVEPWTPGEPKDRRLEYEIRPTGKPALVTYIRLEGDFWHFFTATTSGVQFPGPWPKAWECRPLPGGCSWWWTDAGSGWVYAPEHPGGESKPPSAMAKTDADLLDFLKTCSRAGSWSGLVCDRVLRAPIDDFVAIMDNHCYKARISKDEIRERATNGTLIGIKLEQTADFQDGTAPTYDVIVVPEVDADAQMRDTALERGKMIGRREARNLIAEAFGDEDYAVGRTLAEVVALAAAPREIAELDGVEHFTPLPEIEGWERIPGGVPTYRRTSDGALMIQKTDTPINRTKGAVGLWYGASIRGRLTPDRKTTAEVIADLDVDEPASPTPSDEDTLPEHESWWEFAGVFREYETQSAPVDGLQECRVRLANGVWGDVYTANAALLARRHANRCSPPDEDAEPVPPPKESNGPPPEELTAYREWLKMELELDDFDGSDEDARVRLSRMLSGCELQGLYLGHWHELAEQILGPVPAPPPPTRVSRDAQLRTALNLWHEDFKRDLAPIGKALSDARRYRQWARALSRLPAEATDDEMRAALGARMGDFEEAHSLGLFRHLVRRAIREGWVGVRVAGATVDRLSDDALRAVLSERMGAARPAPSPLLTRIEARLLALLPEDGELRLPAADAALVRLYFEMHAALSRGSR